MRKKTILRLAFTLEIAVFGWFYYYGLHGLKTVGELQCENEAIEKRIELARDDIEMRQQEIIAWQTDPFYREKVAREQLHMAKEGEEIYLC